MTSAGGFASSSRVLTRDLHICASVALSQFALNGFQLLAEVSAALCIGKLRLHILLQLLLNLRDLELGGDVGLHSAEPLFQIKLFQERLFLRHIDVQIGREEIDQLFRVLDASHQDA